MGYFKAATADSDSETTESLERMNSSQTPNGSHGNIAEPGSIELVETAPPRITPMSVSATHDESTVSPQHAKFSTTPNVSDAAIEAQATRELPITIPVTQNAPIASGSSDFIPYMSPHSLLKRTSTGRAYVVDKLSKTTRWADEPPQYDGE